MIRAQAQASVPGHTLPKPVLEPLRSFAFGYKKLHLHLLKLARSENKISRCDLVPERLANLGDPERGFLTRELEDVLEIDEDPLRRLRAQVSSRAGLLHRP